MLKNVNKIKIKNLQGTNKISETTKKIVLKNVKGGGAKDPHREGSEGVDGVIGLFTTPTKNIFFI